MLLTSIDALDGVQVIIGMCPSNFIPLKICVIVVVLLGPPNIDGAPSTEVVLTQLETFVYEKEAVKIFDYRLVLHRGRNVVNGSCAYTHAMTKLNVRIRLDFEKPDRTRFQMLDIKADACKLFNGEMRRHKVVQLVLQQLEAQKGFIKKCPLEANKSYDLDMFDVRAPQFPLPNLKLVTTLTVYDEDNVRKLTEFRLRGAIKRKA